MARNSFLKSDPRFSPGDSVPAIRSGRFGLGDSVWAIRSGRFGPGDSIRVIRSGWFEVWQFKLNLLLLLLNKWLFCVFSNLTHFSSILLLNIKFYIVLLESIVFDKQFRLIFEVIFELKFPNFFRTFFAKISRVWKIWVFT